MLPIACPVVTTMPAWAELDRPQGRKELPRACAAIRVWNRAIETVRCVFEYLPHLPQRRLAVFGGQDRRKDRFHGRHRLIPRHGRISVVSGVAGRPRLAQQRGRRDIDRLIRDGYLRQDPYGALVLDDRCVEFVHKGGVA